MKSLTVGVSESTNLIRIEKRDRFKHIYLVGKTGMGKTSLILDFIRQDSRGEHSIIFLDIKGEEAKRALGLIDKNRLQDVKYCSLETPVSINPLKHPFKSGSYTDHDIHVIFDTLCEIINQAMADVTGQVKLTGGMRDLLRPWITKELQSKHPSLARVFSNILADIEEDNKPKFDKDGKPIKFKKYRGDDALTIGRLAHRLSEVLADDNFNKIVSGYPALDFKEFLETGKVLIINCAGMTEHQQLFLGNVLTKSLTSFFNHAQYEVGQYPPCALFLDEFEAFVNKNFVSVLRRARSYNFSCLLSHQDHANIHGSPMFQRILHSTLSNAGSILAFRIGAYESGMLAREFTNKKYYDFKDADDFTLCVRIGKEENIVRVPKPPTAPKIIFKQRQRPFHLRWEWHET